MSTNIPLLRYHHSHCIFRRRRMRPWISAPLSRYYKLILIIEVFASFLSALREINAKRSSESAI
jgi:hypothetical protein